MNSDRRIKMQVAFLFILASLCSAPFLRGQSVSGQGGDAYDTVSDCDQAFTASPYIPVDSWIYPAVLRLYSMGYVDTVYLGMRPWTRASVAAMLEDIDDRITDAEQDGEPTSTQARKTYEAIERELNLDVKIACAQGNRGVRMESAYSVLRGISGTPLRDSFHLGSTVVNDYGRPYENGFDNYSGLSGYATAGRFTLYLRGEFQGAPSATGYSAALTQLLAGSPTTGDETVNPITGVAYANQATIPTGPIATATQARLLEAYVSAEFLHHVISIGKQDEWLGPAEGGSFAYSNNAENIYALHIDRTEPLHIPVLSSLTGPFRYEFMLGALRGHTLMPNPLYTPNSATQANVINPGNPWIHLEKLSFRPTSNLEFGFERTVIFGGKGHSPVTLHTFLKSFFSTSSPSNVVKNGRDDPGARFAAFDFSYRLPFLRNWVTLYSDGEVHDDVSPIDAPRRAAWRPGIYLSHVPGLPQLDVRVEAATTAAPVLISGNTPRLQEGQFMYWEQIERQGYTNQGQLFGDWMGREDKGGQAWVTYHLSGNEWIQLSARNQKATTDFIAGGTTINDVGVEAAKRLQSDLELKGSFTFEHWKAPIYLSGQQNVSVIQIGVTWYPEKKAVF